MNMTDLGVMPKKHQLEASVPDCDCEDDKKPHYPSMGLSAENLPDIEKYNVGDVVVLTFKAKVTSKDIESWHGDNTHMEFKLLKGACKGAGIMQEKDDEEDATIASKKDVMEDIMDQDNQEDD